MGSIWTSRGFGLGAKSQRCRHRASTRTRQGNRFFFFFFCPFLRATSSSRTREPEREICFHSHVMRRGHTVVCSSRRRQSFETQILLHVAHSLISSLQRDATPLMRNATVFFFFGGGGGTSMTKKKVALNVKKWFIFSH